VLMASAVVVLKHETSTLRQSHNWISIDLTFGLRDNVREVTREVTSPAKFGSDPMSGRDDAWGQHYAGPVTFFCFFYSSTELQPIPVNQFSRTKLIFEIYIADRKVTTRI